MASRAFAYNTGSSINGTEQLGNLAIQTTFQDYSSDPGSVKWWNGPDEDLGYIIAESVPGNNQPTPVSGVLASVGFFRSDALTDPSFIGIANVVAGPSGPFASAANAKTWLNSNGYWTSYGDGVQAVLAFSFVNYLGSGNIGARLEVTSGTLIDNMGYYSFSNNAYQSTGCSGTLVTGGVFNSTLFPPGPVNTSTGVYNAGQGVLSAQAISLFVGDQAINSASQTITVNGNNYTITGGTNCFDVN
jgi:hypothetical protein